MPFVFSGPLPAVDTAKKEKWKQKYREKKRKCEVVSGGQLNQK